MPGSDVAIAIVATITAAAGSVPPPPSAPPTTPLGERASFRMDHVAKRELERQLYPGDAFAAELASMTAHEEMDTHGVFVARALGGVRRTTNGGRHGATAVESHDLVLLACAPPMVLLRA